MFSYSIHNARTLCNVRMRRTPLKSIKTQCEGRLEGRNYGSSLISIRKYLGALLYFFELSQVRRKGYSIIREETCIENMQEISSPSSSSYRSGWSRNEACSGLSHRGIYSISSGNYLWKAELQDLNIPGVYLGHYHLNSSLRRSGLA